MKATHKVQDSQCCAPRVQTLHAQQVNRSLPEAPDCLTLCVHLPSLNKPPADMKFLANLQANSLLLQVIHGCQTGPSSDLDF